MLLLPQRRLFLNTNSHYNRGILMGSKHLLLLKSTLTPEKYSIFYIFENHISNSSDEFWVELLPQCRYAYSQTSAKVGIRKRKAYLFTSQKMAMWTCFRAKCGWSGTTRNHQSKTTIQRNHKRVSGTGTFVQREIFNLVGAL
ncbi:uncharacterized protein LOC111396971 isoform X3 [Olea europaea var. sylvestris]|uniref:uncharacterized protein LOC111396971 isoform X3 n=1 Tax=Olea europaea var. sylvestris TaxID=158386 RepID=UPI000C1D69CA|nr:uncharacterized protein LOC111396971 isoform X3 [Olea europaea var. sylvestris]